MVLDDGDRRDYRQVFRARGARGGACSAPLSCFQINFRRVGISLTLSGKSLPLSFPLRFHSSALPLPVPPLEVGPLNTARDLGEHCKLH